MKANIEQIIILEETPEVDIKNGILIVFDKETKNETKYAYADILKGQKEYPLPLNKGRKIEAIYLKI